MRLAPVPMYFLVDAAAVFRYAGESTRTTHGAQEAIECSRLFGLQLHAALGGASKEDILAISYPEPLSPKVHALTTRDFLGKSREQIRGSGYSVESLEAALWCFWHSASFEEAVLAAANLGDDADTTAAICGQLAGAHFGVEQIPPDWLDQLAMRDDITELADRLLAERAI